jgi:hypothetical protein
MAKVVKAPGKYKLDKFTIFLAGSIDMGKAEDWQTRVTKKLEDLDVLFLNPRRDDWDSSWVQSIDNKQFRQQVEWELQGQEDANLVVFYFADGSESPITLLELGLAAGANVPAVIYCTDKFHRKGNVDVVANRYSIPVVETEEEFIEIIREAAQ